MGGKSAIKINIETNGKIMTSIMSPNVFFGRFNNFTENKSIHTDFYVHSLIEVNSLVFQTLKNLETEYNTFIFNKILAKSSIRGVLDDSLKNLPFNEFLDTLFNTKDSSMTLMVIADNKEKTLSYHTTKVDPKDFKDEYLLISVTM